LAWRETRKTTAQGYVSIGGEGGRISEDEVLEGEEEGNGRAIVEAHEEEGHVRVFHFDSWRFDLSRFFGTRLN
jgi:hypothetical protein